jgi:prophage regulatory protein
MKLLSYAQLRSEKGVTYSKVHLWRLEAAGKFPQRVRLGERRYGWLSEEIDRWLEQCAASREWGAA